MSKHPEILAPVGSMETLYSALRTGADAVYAGGRRFSARAGAVNFSDEELSEAVRLCHSYGAKLYLAVNTIISDNEAVIFSNYIKYTASVGVDAYIVQDWGAFEIIRNAVPDAVIHASTQMSVHTVAGTEFLRELGFKRIVPARELDRNVLEKICSTGIETEVFVHGALCMSVSGQCYMSAVMGGRSANRGACGQACRLPFSACGNKNYCGLSLKDLSLFPKVEELENIGIDSLKIEGRMKRPEYVASAVNELKKSLEGKTPDMNLLKGIFSRDGFTDGYYTGNIRNMFGTRQKEDVVSSHELIPKIHELYRNERQVHEIDFEITIRKDFPIEVKAVCEDITVCAKGGIACEAEKRPTDINTIYVQLSKLGGTVFYARSIKGYVEKGLFVSSGTVNALRREITNKLTEQIVRKNTPQYHITDYVPEIPKNTSEIRKFCFRTFCRTVEQAETALEYSEYVILDSNISMSEMLIAENPDIVNNKEKIILSVPRFICDEEKVIKILENIKKRFGFSHLFCHTPDSIAIGKKLGMKLHGSFTLNVFNSYSAEYLKNIGLEDCVFSFEAKLSQFNDVSTGLLLGALVYGNIPLMLTRNCPVKNETGCRGCKRRITDRTGRNLPIVCHKEFTEILNSDTLYMLDRLNDFKNISFGLVMLNVESSEQVRELFENKKPCGSLTKGLYYRGLQEVL